MPTEVNIYGALWSKYRPAVLQFMKLSLQAPQTYQLSKHEFDAVGARFKTPYVFSLDINDGALQNNIRGTAVARDLMDVLKSSKTANELFKNNHFHITLNKNFVLGITGKQLVAPVEEAAAEEAGEEPAAE